MKFPKWLRSSRGRGACAALADLPVRRVALIDERLRWVSLDGLMVDLATGGARRTSRIGAREAEAATELLAARMATRTEAVREVLTTAGGHRIEIDAVPITTGGDRPLVLGIARDPAASAAHHHQHETTAAELALSVEAFRAAFDDAPGAVAMVAGRGEPDGRILRVNPAFARMLGVTIADLHLREIAQITHPDDRDLEAAVTEDDGTRTVRKRYLHSSGRAVHVEVRISEVRDAGGVVSYLVNHVVDLDAREASERALRDAARIRRDMVSTISHELRTPLTNVHGYLEMIAGEDFGALTDEQKHMIDIAMRNAVRLEEFVADLLMLARLDAAELDPIRYLPIDLVTVVRAAVSEVVSAGTDRSQELLVDAPDAPVTISADAAHLRRAVQSLIANAVKYTAEGGRVRVSVACVDDVAQVEVVDTGMGINADEIALLGNRFYRGVDAQRRAIGGTGLGLAITKTIVERHGGTLEIASTPGVGSTFTISLPLRGAGGA